MSSDLEFRGGAGGVTADLLDMRSTARVLDERGTELAAIAGRARGLTVDGDLLQSVPFSPGSAARAEALLLSAATQLTLRLVRLEALATLLRTKADLIELADDAQAFGGRAIEHVGGYAAGRLAIPLGLTAVAGGVLWFTGGTVGEGGEAVLDALRGDIGLAELADRLQAAPVEQAADMQEAAVLLLRDHPGITDAVIGGLPGFVNGVAGPYAPLVPDTYEGLLALLIGAAARAVCSRTARSGRCRHPLRPPSTCATWRPSGRTPTPCSDPSSATVTQAPSASARSRWTASSDGSCRSRAPRSGGPDRRATPATSPPTSSSWTTVMPR